jgi:hypothetical protein
LVLTVVTPPGDFCAVATVPVFGLTATAFSPLLQTVFPSLFVTQSAPKQPAEINIEAIRKMVFMFIPLGVNGSSFFPHE